MSNKLEWQALQHLLDVLLGLVILDLLSGRTWTVPRIFAFVHDCTINTQRTNSFTFLDVWNVMSSYVFVTCHRACDFAVRTLKIIVSFLHIQMNSSTKISIFTQKMGVRIWINKVYELLEILQYVWIWVQQWLILLNSIEKWSNMSLYKSQGLHAHKSI